MKFTCERQGILKVLGFITRRSRGSQIVPMELMLAAGTLTFRSANATMYLRAGIQCTGDEDGTVLVDGALLCTCIKALPKGEISFGGKKRLRVSQGKRVRHVQTLSNDYAIITPKVGKQLEYTIDLAAFFSAMENVGFAVSTDDNRPILQSYYFSDALGAVIACDGLRAAYSILDVPLSESFLLPAFVVTALKDVMKLGATEITMRCTPPGWLEFDADTYVIRAATLGGDYPTTAVSMGQTVPYQPNATVVYLPKAEWLSVLNMAHTYADAAAKSQASQMLTVTIQDDQTIIFEMAVTSVGDMKDALDAEIIGEPMVIGVHPTLLLQAIRRCPGENVSLHVWSPHKPFMLQSDGWMVLQAPMGGQEVAERHAAAMAERIREQAAEAEPPQWDWEDEDGDF